MIIQTGTLEPSSSIIITKGKIEAMKLKNGDKKKGEKNESATNGNVGLEELLKKKIKE